MKRIFGNRMVVPSFSGLLKESAKIKPILVIKNGADSSYRKGGVAAVLLIEQFFVCDV